MINLRAVTVCQPWAWLIAEGHKPVENRTCAWMFKAALHGELAIHAGKAETHFTDHAMGMVRHAERDKPKHLRMVGAGDFVKGAIVAVVRLVSIETEAAARRRYKDDPDALMYVEGPVCLILERVWKVPEPVACRGMQGLWMVPEEVAAEVVGQLGMKKAGVGRGEAGVGVGQPTLFRGGA